MLEYRSQLVFTMIMEVIGFIGIIIYWQAVYKDQTLVGGLSIEYMLSYYLIMPLIYMLTYINIAEDIGNDIKNGVLANHLLKPYYSQFWYANKVIGQRIISIILQVPFYIIPLVVLSALGLFSTVGTAILACVIVVIFSILMYMVFDFCIGYSAFWLDDVWAFRHIKEIVIGSLGGMSFPLALVQDPTLKAVIDALPFKYIFYTPMQYLLGQKQFAELSGDILQILLWIILFGIIAIILWKLGLRKYEAYGQ